MVELHEAYAAFDEPTSDQAVCGEAARHFPVRKPDRLVLPATCGREIPSKPGSPHRFGSAAAGSALLLRVRVELLAMGPRREPTPGAIIQRIEPVWSQEY